MRRQGVETLVDCASMAVMGLTEVLKRYGFFRRVFRQLLQEARVRQPDAIILIDYPGFNLRFAREAHRLGLKVIYYICPQVWAWNRARIPKMAEWITRLITIFPFEAAHFSKTGLDVTYVGHPLVDEAANARVAPMIPWEGEPRLALLPGSREHEVRRHLDLMCTTAHRLETFYPGLTCRLAAPDQATADLLHSLLPACRFKPSRLEVRTGETRAILRAATATLVASGTATVETALMGSPMVIVYRVGALTYAMARHLVKIEHIGMVNIIAGKTICPEFIQQAAQPERIADALRPLLMDSPERRDMLEHLRGVTAALGPGGAAQKAAQAVLNTIA